MRFVSTMGDHLIIIRLPVFTSVVLTFYVPVITDDAVRQAAREAAKLLLYMLSRLPSDAWIDKKSDLLG